MPQHADLPDAGQHTHFDIDLQLPEPNEKDALAGAGGTPTAANRFVTEDLIEQDLGEGDSPTFAGLTLTGNLELGANNLKGITATIGSDAYTSWTPGMNIGAVLIYARNSTYKQWWGLFFYRTAATHFTEIIASYVHFKVSTGALTGTTGEEFTVTLSANSADGKLYLENRHTATISLSILHLGM